MEDLRERSWKSSNAPHHSTSRIREVGFKVRIYISPGLPLQGRDEKLCSRELGSLHLI